MSKSRDDGLETQTGRAWKNEAQHTWGFVATLLHSHVRSVLAPMTLSPNCTVLPSLSLEGMLVLRDERTPSINRTIEGAPAFRPFFIFIVVVVIRLQSSGAVIGSQKEFRGDLES